jgi:predicted Zn-dependent protease
MNSRVGSRLLTTVFALVLLAACSTTETGRAQLTMKSERQMEYEAKQVYEMMRANLPLVKDQATINYVACVANALIDVLEEPEKSMYWELALFDQPVVNASVMAGGKISVYSGLLAQAQNQHQVASVMGHEMAHAISKHPNERASRAAVSDVGIEIAALILGGGYYNQTQGVYGALKSAEDLGLNRPFTRKQETEADEIGLIYMARAGFDPRESVQLWQNMASVEKARPAEILSTHPSDETRLENQVKQLPSVLAIYNEARAAGREPNCTK